MVMELESYSRNDNIMKRSVYKKVKRYLFLESMVTVITNRSRGGHIDVLCVDCDEFARELHLNVIALARSSTVREAVKIRVCQRDERNEEVEEK